MSLKHNFVITFLRRTVAAKIKSLIYFKLNLLFNDLPAGKASVLMYHSVDINPVFFTVKLSEFKKQMAYLFQKKYNVVSLQQLKEYFKKRNIPPKTVILTFDDGYQDNYYNVLPILKEYNFPATIFLATGFIGREIPNSANHPLKALNWQQIKEMHNSGLVDFQPHTVNHPKMNQIDLSKAKIETLQSKKHIEENLQKQCVFFAYPKGYYNKQIEEMLKELRFSFAFAIKEGLVSTLDNAFALKRNSIDSSVSHHQFKGKISRTVEIFRKIFRA